MSHDKTLDAKAEAVEEFLVDLARGAGALRAYLKQSSGGEEAKARREAAAAEAVALVAALVDAPVRAPPRRPGGGLCCDKAKAAPTGSCVCGTLYRCEDHGETHVGTHD